MSRQAARHVSIHAETMELVHGVHTDVLTVPCVKSSVANNR